MMMMMMMMEMVVDEGGEIDGRLTVD